MGPRHPRRRLLGLLAAMMAAPALAQSRPGPPPAVADPRATHFTLGPPGDEWRILIGLPDAPPPPRGYSVILSLDGQGTFPHLWHYREDRAAGLPVLLVGIGYEGANRRWRDLTSRAMAPVAPIPFYRAPPADYVTGGREAFLAMIEDELLPELARRYRIDRDDMTVYGHSLGGLFVVHALLSRPHLFARYVASDPSVWWNAGESQREAMAFAAGVTASGGAVRPRIQVMIAQAGRARQGHPHDATALVAILSRVPGIEMLYRPYPREDHGTVMGLAAGDALDLHLWR